MGWKNIKDHYRISHIVQVKNNNICVGSAFIGDSLIIDPNGNIIKWQADCADIEMKRYYHEMISDQLMLQLLAKKPDHFAQSIPVYTYHENNLVQKFCEKVGWPNFTHDGELMYENTFSTDKDVVLGWIKRNITLDISFCREHIAATEFKLKELKLSLIKYQNDLDLFNLNRQQ